jgi:hypothetical protein
MMIEENFKIIFTQEHDPRSIERSHQEHERHRRGQYSNLVRSNRRIGEGHRSEHQHWAKGSWSYRVQSKLQARKKN